jgi:hypothetical protein
MYKTLSFNISNLSCVFQMLGVVLDTTLFGIIR